MGRLMLLLEAIMAKWTLEEHLAFDIAFLRAFMAYLSCMKAAK